MRILWAIVVAGCAAPRASAPSNRSDAKPPEVELVVAHDHRLRFVKTTPTGLVVTRTVKLPSSLGNLEWVGPEPVVMLRANIYDDVARDDSSRDGELARITENGYEPFPGLPDATRTVTRKPGADRVGPVWGLTVGAAGDIWQGRCEWGGIADGGWCDDWVFARRAPTPVIITHDEPKAAPHRRLPDIPPSTRTNVRLVDGPGDHD